MAEQENGKKFWITKDSFVPVGSLAVTAVFAWWVRGIFQELSTTMLTREVVQAEQRRETDLAIQAIRFTVEAQGRDLAEVKESVRELTQRGQK